jgi:RecA/RadA recombinase
MARKKTESSEVEAIGTVSNSFGLFNKMKTGNRFADSKKSKNAREFFNTKCYALNIAYGGDVYKGLPSNRVVMLAGEEAVGKTYLTVHNHCIPFAEKGYFTFYIDTENAVDDQQLIDAGMPEGSFKILREQSVEGIRQQVSNIVKQVDEHNEGKAESEHMKCAFVIDSMGNTTTVRALEQTDAGKNAKDMTKQAEWKRLFAELTVPLGINDIPFIITNHVYQDVGSYIQQKVVSGGSGGKYNASIILMLRKRQDKDEKSKKLKGLILVAKVEKSRFVKPNTEVEFYLDMDRGLNPYYGLHKFALEANLIQEWKREYEETRGIMRPKEVVGKKGTLPKIWMICDPRKPESEWVTCTEGRLHKQETIGTILDPINEWVHENLKFKKASTESFSYDEFEDVEDIDEETGEVFE